MSMDTKQDNKKISINIALTQMCQSNGVAVK